MLIICPKCFAKYEIDTKQFNEETHIFQCSNCGKRFEERVHFDDEKNKGQTSVPPVFITEQPILPPLSENDYISSNREAMGLSSKNKTVLPEEFTPVSDTGNSIGRKIVFIIMLLFIFAFVGICTYIYMNKSMLLKKYPEIQKAIDLILTPTTQVSSSVLQEELPMEGEGGNALVAQEVVLTPIEQKMQEKVDLSSDIAERILPVETQDVFSPEKSVSKEDTSVLEQKVEPSRQKELEKIPDNKIVSQKTSEDSLVFGGTADISASELSPKKVADIVVEQPIEEEIILEDITFPEGIVVPIVEENQSEMKVSPADVQIRDVSFKYDQTDAEQRLFVQGVVSNITEHVIKMPSLQVQLFDMNNALLGVKDLPYGDVQMPAKSDEFFFYELTDIPSGVVAKIDVIVKGE